MLVSIAAYAWIWGLPFAIGFVLLIFVHELGHVLELRRQGVPASAPLFIPFLGAVIGMKELPDDAWKEARVALAGPILGSVGAAACWIAAEATGSELLMALAFVGFFLNLFNLIPIVPLDGGRAAGALHPALWFVGLLMMVGLVVVNPNPLLLIIVLLGGLDLWRRWRERGEAGDYYRLTVGQRVDRRRRVPRPRRRARARDVGDVRRARLLMPKASSSRAGSSGGARSRSRRTSRSSPPSSSPGSSSIQQIDRPGGLDLRLGAHRRGRRRRTSRRARPAARSPRRASRSSPAAGRA